MSKNTTDKFTNLRNFLLQEISARNCSQAELARLIKLPTSNLSTYIHKKSFPSDKATLDKLASLRNWTADQFLSYLEGKPLTSENTQSHLEETNLSLDLLKLFESIPEDDQIKAIHMVVSRFNPSVQKKLLLLIAKVALEPEYA